MPMIVSGFPYPGIAMAIRLGLLATLALTLLGAGLLEKEGLYEPNTIPCAISAELNSPELFRLIVD